MNASSQSSKIRLHCAGNGLELQMILTCLRSPGKTLRLTHSPWPLWLISLAAMTFLMTMSMNSPWPPHLCIRFKHFKAAHRNSMHILTYHTVLLDHQTLVNLKKDTDLNAKNANTSAIRLHATLITDQLIITKPLKKQLKTSNTKKPISGHFWEVGRIDG